MRAKVRMLLGAAGIFVLFVTPVAVAGAVGGAGNPEATASASVKKKLKKLKRRVAALEAQLGEVGPPSGPAGGDLTGSYPDPLIGTGAVDSANVANNTLGGIDIGPNAVGPGEVQNHTRSVNLPIGALLADPSGAPFDNTESDGNSPDYEGGFLEWDDDSDGGGGNVADTGLAAGTLTVPQDYASGGSVAVRVSKDAHGGVSERLRSSTIVNGAVVSLGDSPTTTSANSTSYVLTQSGTYNAGDSVRVRFGVDDGAGGDTADDIVRLQSIEFRYTATQ